MSKLKILLVLIFNYSIYYTKKSIFYLYNPFINRHKILKIFFIIHFLYHCISLNGILISTTKNIYEIYKTEQTIKILTNKQLYINTTLKAIKNNKHDTLDELKFEYSGKIPPNSKCYILEE